MRGRIHLQVGPSMHTMKMYNILNVRKGGQYEMQCSATNFLVASNSIALLITINVLVPKQKKHHAICASNVGSRYFFFTLIIARLNVSTLQQYINKPRPKHFYEELQMHLHEQRIMNAEFFCF